ncbi:uncharacterized protein KQ657_000212 [Scheffersomyces spartinae]|uniref:Copper transport protein n=1 Tax=Scheffersomyces spartinae TaxID=45513 RepID=A0A9P8AK79_9ASCO|nr:uncharacterized protein KQ657_000212 [Scheffersomyces spartinae]KAG7196200.1 hypothetical protein KQ657_000212 [Scheffersomyces spartinae]
MSHSSRHNFAKSHDMPMDPHMPMEDMCLMNMLFTWDWKNTCVVFKWWHIKTLPQFLVSFFAIVIITMLYELLKAYVSHWEVVNLQNVAGIAPDSDSRTIKQFRVKQAITYGIQVGYSFLLMLVFMTYSGWLWIAIVLGAGLGKFFWGSGLATPRSLACH